jgi:hypothetical protein
VAAVTISRPARAVLAGLLALALGWLVAPRWAPPVYDGVGFPDEPYRFVVRPPGAPPTKAPTAASRVVPVVKGIAAAVSLASAEQAPQIAILIPTGRLQAPPGVKQFVLRATPVRPISAPSGGYFWSNVYDVAASNPKVTMRDASPPATITLRAATAQRPVPSIERYAGGVWTKLDTVPVGNDIYQATLPGLGKYAVIGSSPLDVGQLKNGSGAKNAATSATGVVIAVVAVVVVVLLVVIGIRRRRKPADEPDEDDAIPDELTSGEHEETAP